MLDVLLGPEGQVLSVFHDHSRAIKARVKQEHDGGELPIMLVAAPRHREAACLRLCKSWNQPEQAKEDALVIHGADRNPASPKASLEVKPPMTMELQLGGFSGHQGQKSLQTHDAWLMMMMVFFY